MGQMHVQRAIELPDGPTLVIATEVDEARLQAVQDRFAPLADEQGVELLFYNPMTAEESLYDFVMRTTDNVGADDVVVSVPIASVMAEAATLMNPNGMLNFFAGVPNGTLAPLDFGPVYLHNAQFTGTSGLTIDDQAQVMYSALDGTLSPARLVAAIGGMNVSETVEGLERYPINLRFPRELRNDLTTLRSVAVLSYRSTFMSGTGTQTGMSLS